MSMDKYFEDASPHGAQHSADLRGLAKALRQIREDELRKSREHPLDRKRRLSQDLVDDEEGEDEEGIPCQRAVDRLA